MSILSRLQKLEVVIRPGAPGWEALQQAHERQAHRIIAKLVEGRELTPQEEQEDAEDSALFERWEARNGREHLYSARGNDMLLRLLSDEQLDTVEQLVRDAGNG